jgi:RNA polymerase sigma-70 factor, ECF subfamily
VVEAGGVAGDPAASEEAAWIARARAGDRVALALLYERHERAIFGFAYRALGDAGEAVAATERTFLRAYRALDRPPAACDAAQNVSVCLHRLAAQICLGAQRRRRWARFLPWRRGRPDRAGDAARQAIWRALDALSPRDRQALLLREWAGLSVGEIAAVLGVPPGAGGASLARARETFGAAHRAGGEA